jgi:hypothetical protein
MWISNVDRNELIGITQGQLPRDVSLREAPSIKDLERFYNDTLAIWADQPKGRVLPNVLMIPSREKEEFLAWASSYLKVKPLTAFIRVFDFDVLDTVRSTRMPADRWCGAITGVILAEMLTYLEQPGKASLRICEGTFSFAVARSFLRVHGVDALAHTGANWFRTRLLLGNRVSKLSRDQLEQVWRPILRLSESDSDQTIYSDVVLACCQDLLKEGDVREENWQLLTMGTGIHGRRELMEDTREERVISLDRALRAIALNPDLDSDRAAFLAGYLTSMVAPGTLDHWHLLSSTKRSLPTAGLWYGLCAGLRQDHNLEGYGGGLGRLVIRELQRKVDLLERPTCDIAVDELQTLGSMFRSELTSGGTSIEIEVSPCVSVPFRSTPQDQAQTELHLDFGSARAAEQKLDPKILENLDEAIDALEEIRREIRRGGSSSEGSYVRKPRKKRSVR